MDRACRPSRCANRVPLRLRSPDSPVAAGFTGVHAGVAYSPGKRYGWSAGMPVDYTAPKPALNRRRWYHFDPHFFYDEMASDLRMDGVESDGSLSFKVDVPAGRYRVIVTAGHLNEARYGIDITANGKLVAKKVDARHWLRRSAAGCTMPRGTTSG